MPAPQPAPEITAIHVLALLAPTAPADAVIAIRRTDERVLVAEDPHGAVVVYTRRRLLDEHAMAELADIEAVDAIAMELTETAAGLLADRADAAA